MQYPLMYSYPSFFKYKHIFKKQNMGEGPKRQNRKIRLQPFPDEHRTDKVKKGRQKGEGFSQFYLTIIIPLRRSGIKFQ